MLYCAERRLMHSRGDLCIPCLVPSDGVVTALDIRMRGRRTAVQNWAHGTSTGPCCRTVDMHIRVGPLPDTRNLLQSKRITSPGNHHIAYPAAPKNSVAGDVVV